MRLRYAVCMLVPSFPASISYFRDWFLPMFQWVQSVTPIHGIEATFVAFQTQFSELALKENKTLSHSTAGWRRQQAGRRLR